MSTFPDSLSLAHSTVVLKHKLVFILLVSFLSKLIVLVISVWIVTDCRHHTQTSTHYYYCSLVWFLFAFTNNSCNVNRFFVESRIKLLRRCTVTQVDLWLNFTALLSCTEMHQGYFGSYIRSKRNKVCMFEWKEEKPENCKKNKTKNKKDLTMPGYPW